MTPSRLAEIKALADAATPGPWLSRDGEVFRPDFTGIAHEVDDDDSDFIAASRTAVPELVAEVERLRDQFSVLTEEYRDQLSENSHMREEVDRLTALLAERRCGRVPGSFRCALDEQS